MNADRNYYETLGIAPLAEDVVIKAAYKAMAQKYHPDKFQGSVTEASAKMADINQAYAVLINEELRRAYDEAGKNSQSRDVVANEAAREEAESSDHVIRQNNSCTISPRIPQLLVRSFVVGILFVFAGALMSSVFANIGGDVVIGFGLMGLAFITFPSFVWWVARGGIKDDLLGKLLRYSFYAIPLLFILGGLGGTFSKNSADGEISVAVYGIIFPFLMFFAVCCAWLARRVYRFFAKIGITATEGATNSSDNIIAASAATNSSRHNEIVNRWTLSAQEVSFLDENSQIHASNLTAFAQALAKKRKNFFFDKKVEIEQCMSIDVTSAWILIRDSFDELKSSKEKFLSSGYKSYSKQTQKESGGAEVGYQSQKLQLGNGGATGVDCVEKRVLTFSAGHVKVSIYPSMVIVELKSYQRVFPIDVVAVSLVIGKVVGDAPSDANVVGQRWKYLNLSGPNKGQPDMRYKDNEEVDLYQVEWLRFAFDGGELDFGFSKAGCTKLFAQHFELLKLCNQGDGNSVFKPAT